MRLGDRLRVSGAFVVAPVATALAVWFLLANEPPGDPQAVSVGVGGALPTLLVAPVVAAAAALSGARLRRSGWHRRPTVRSSVAVVVEQVWPLVLSGALALAVATAVTASGLSFTGLPDLTPLAPAVVMLVAASVTGLSLGMRLWGPIAVAAAGAAWFFLLAFPVALDPPWLRHLVGVDSCCQAFESLDRRAPFASTLTAASLIAVGLLAFSSARLRRAHLLGGTLGVVAVLVIAALTVRPLGWSATTAREGQMDCVESDEVEFCVWPEQAHDLERVSDIGGRALGAVTRTTGVSSPTLLSTGSDVDQVVGERGFWFSFRDDDEAIVRQVTSAAFPDVTPCMGVSGSSTSPGMDRLVEVGWLAGSWWQAQGLAAFAGDHEVTAEIVDDVTNGDQAALRAILALDLADQAAWLDQAAQSVATCEPEEAPTLPIAQVR